MKVEKMNAEFRLKKARTKLMLTSDPKFVFMAHLCEIPWVADDSVGTACTDGRCVKWSPKYVESINDDELYGLVLEELWHIGLLHVVTMRQFSDHKRANIAADLAINSIQKSLGLPMADGIWYPGARGTAAEDFPELKSLETYYKLLEQVGDDQLPEPQPGRIVPIGSDQAPGQELSSLEVEAATIRLKVQVGNALEKARGTGSFPEELGTLIETLLQPKINYVALLKRFKTKLARGGADWSRPNRRLRAVGLHGPTNRTRIIGQVVILHDASGSRGEEDMQRDLAEITGVFATGCQGVTILQHDTGVIDETEWKRGQPLPKLHRRTHGGTSHVAPFRRALELKPELIICLTDCQTSYPKEKPRVPVFWLSHEAVSSRDRPPWGSLIVL